MKTHVTGGPGLTSRIVARAVPVINRETLRVTTILLGVNVVLYTLRLHPLLVLQLFLHDRVSARKYDFCSENDVRFQECLSDTTTHKIPFL
jgi:hypothetical protein